MNDPNTPLKRCTKCKQYFPPTPEYFNRNRQQRSGLHSKCRQCRMQERRGVPESDASKRRRLAYRERNRERERERARRWREKPGNRERDLEHTRRFRAEHPEWRRQWANDNADHVREYNRRYRREHRGRWLATAQITNIKRRTRRRQLPHTSTLDEWQRALAYFNGCCAVCGRPPGLWHTLAQDHWIPLSAPDCPGTVVTNIVPLCHGIGGCNNSKHDRQPFEWLKWKFGARRARKIAALIEAYFASLE